MVQPNGMTRGQRRLQKRQIKAEAPTLDKAQRRETNKQTPFGRTKSGKVRVVARGTGAKKVFGMINIPLAIYNAFHKGKTQPNLIIKPPTPSGTVGFD